MKISAPGGRLRLPADAEKLAFLVGGSRSHAVRSLLRDAADRPGVPEAVVLYGNRDDSCEPYLDELLAMRDIGVDVVRVLEHPPRVGGGARLHHRRGGTPVPRRDDDGRSSSRDRR